MEQSGETKDAIANAWKGADSAWQDEALRAIQTAAKGREFLTTDHVWATGLGNPREPRAMGAAMVIASRESWIEPTARWAQSTKRSCHNRPKRVWRSLLWTPGQIDR